jgi:hypothetical protein
VRIAEVHRRQLDPPIHRSAKEREKRRPAHPKAALPQLVCYLLQTVVVRARIDASNDEAAVQLGEDTGNFSELHGQKFQSYQNTCFATNSLVCGH